MVMVMARVMMMGIWVMWIFPCTRSHYALHPICSYGCIDIPLPRNHNVIIGCFVLQKQLNLRRGRNVITFTVQSALQGTQTVCRLPIPIPIPILYLFQLEACIFLWSHTARIVISDIDGTITRSDILGNIMPLMGKDWSHSGVTSLFSNIKDNGYDILYLTSRAIGQANVTRDFLYSVRQGEDALPEGRVSPCRPIDNSSISPSWFPSPSHLHLHLHLHPHLLVFQAL